MATQLKDRVFERDVGRVLPVGVVAEKLIKEQFILDPLSTAKVVSAPNSETISRLQGPLTHPGAAKSDTALVGEVAQALAHQAGIKNPLIIRAYNRVITLRGHLDAKSDLDLAEGAALSIPGVKAVINGQTLKAVSKAPVTGATYQAHGGSYTPPTPSAVPGWTLPTGELAILGGAEVFARDGKVGQVIGIGFRVPQMEAQYLIVEKPGLLFKSRRFLPFMYIEGSYFVGDPAIFLKISRSKFNDLTKEFGAIQPQTSLRQLTQTEFSDFGNQTPIYLLGQKLGWLGGVLLDRQKPYDLYPASYKISHYIWKTGHDSKRLLFPYEALEKRSGENRYDFLPDRGDILAHPEQFNGNSEPKLVVDRVLEKLAWSAQMQHWGGRLRVSYRGGEVFLEGTMPARAKPQDLIEVVESVPGVRRVHNLIKVRA
jgi:osmotically-inducible protein OsmY